MRRRSVVEDVVGKQQIAGTRLQTVSIGQLTAGHVDAAVGQIVKAQTTLTVIEPRLTVNLAQTDQPELSVGPYHRPRPNPTPCNEQQTTM